MVAVETNSDTPEMPRLSRLVVAVWLIVLTSIAQFRTRHADALWEGDGIDSQVKFQILVWGSLALLAGYFLLTKRADFSVLFRGPLFWYLLYTVAALGTCIYSASPVLTIFRAGQLMVMIVLVSSMREQIVFLPWLLCIYPLINFILCVLANAGLHGGMEWMTGEDGVYLLSGSHEFEPWRFATAYGHPSIISILAAVAVISFAARMRKDQILTHVPVMGWLLLCILLTSSRTAIAGAAGGLMWVAFGRRLGMQAILLAGVLLPPFVLLPPVQEAVANYMKRGQSDSEFESLTGRDVIYTEALKRIDESWPIGLGFQANRFELISEEAGFVGITHSHNLVLESAVAMGVIGVFLALAIAFSAAWCGVVCMRRYSRGVFGEASIGYELVGVLIPIFAFCILDRGYATSVGADAFMYATVFAFAQYARVGEKRFLLRPSAPEELTRPDEAMPRWMLPQPQ